MRKLRNARGRDTWTIVASAAIMAAVMGARGVRGQTWVGPGTDWNTASNWNPASVPNSSSAVTFGPTGVGTVNISSNASAQSLTFNNPTGNYVLTSSANQTLNGVTSITVSAVLGANTDNINLTSVPAGNLLFPSGNSLTITNNAPSALGSTLNFDSSTVIGTPTNGGVIFTGAGHTAFFGSFASTTSSNFVVGGITKSGPGTLDDDGDGSNLSGGMALNGGTLFLNYFGSTAPKLASGTLTLDGGLLLLGANMNTNVTQTISNGTVVNAGQNDVQGISSANLVTLAAGAITHNVGGTADFSPQSGVLAITTSTGNTNGLLGSGPAFATVNGGANWAMASGGNIAPVTTYSANTYNPGINTSVTVLSTVLPGDFTTNSLRFNFAQGPVLTITSTLTLQSGGILVPPSAAGGAQITGGILTATGGGELLFHVYGPNLEIFSNVVSSSGITKTGPGLLLLEGASPSLTGPININRGNLEVLDNVTAVNSASQINFNDNRDSTTQQFIVDLNFVNGTITPPIRVSDYGGGSAPDDYGTQFTTGTSSTSTITLSGVLSSPAGLTTPIRFASHDNTSGFNLTNANTFTGNISLTQGSLGITSDASLGNAGNTLYLEVGSSTQGGLVFLNSGINVAHPVVLTNSSRIVSNGADSNTISSVISGAGTLFKDGTGALTISNAANSFNGGLTVTAGTLSLGTTGSIATGTNVTVSSGATFSPGTSTNAAATALGTVTLNGGTLRHSSGSAPFYINQIVTGATGGTIDYTGANGGQLNLVNAGAQITINGNSTWLAGAAAIGNLTSGSITITITSGVMLTSSISWEPDVGGFGFIITGGGTLYQIADPEGIYTLAPFTVSQGTYRVTDASSPSGGAGNIGDLGQGTFTLNGGTMSYGGVTATTSKAMSLTSNGGTIKIESATAALTANGAITGPGVLTKIGPGTLVLGSSANSFTSLLVNAGTVQTDNDNTLGASVITANAAGTLLYSATTSTARTFTLGSGTLSVGSGATLTLNAATVTNAFMGGPGTFALANNTILNNVTISSGSTLTQTGSVTANNSTNVGNLTINGHFLFSGGLNLGTINDNSELVTLSSTNNGIINLTAGNTLTNYTSNLILGSGAQLNIGTIAAPGGFVGLQGGTTIEVNGATLVNDGIISGTTDINAGGAASGGGTYDPVNIAFGGTFQPGSDPTLPSATLSALSGAGSIDNTSGGGNFTLILNTAVDNTYSGPIQNSTGTVALSLQGTGSLTLLTEPLPGGGRSVNTYSGGTTIGAGTALIIGASGALPAGGNVTNNGAFIVEANSVAGVINGTGELVIGVVGSPTNLMLKSGSGASKLGALTLNSTSQLDLTNNPLILEAASAPAKPADIAQLAAEVLSGRNGGAWNGPGITSSTVTAHPTTLSVAIADNATLGYGTFGGQSVDSNSILVVPAVLGDANLDGIVNGADFTILASNFNASDVGWTGGDFNNDGVVNFADFAALSNDFGDTFAAISSSALPASASGVPEPASLALLGAGLLGLLGRRRTL